MRAEPWLLLIALAVTTSLAAAVVALIACRRSSLHAARSLSCQLELAAQLRKTKQLENQVSELDDAWQKSLDQLKRLRSRVGMRDLRERMSADDSQDVARLHGPAWKQKMRAKLKLGAGSPTQASIFGGSSEG